MGSIAANALPRPGMVTPRGGPVRLQSRDGHLLFTHTPDPDLVPRSWLFEWFAPHGAVGDAIRSHYDQHGQAVFTVTIPRTGEVVHVRWLSPPSIQWASAVSIASIAVELEEALAHE